MLKNITAAFFALLITAGCAWPQDQQDPELVPVESMHIVTASQCMPESEFIDYLTQQFGHEPLMLGYGYVILILEDGSEDIVGGVMFLTTNQDTRTFSVSITFDDGVSCNLISGLNLQPMPSLSDHEPAQTRPGGTLL